MNTRTKPSQKKQSQRTRQQHVPNKRVQNTNHTYQEHELPEMRMAR